MSLALAGQLRSSRRAIRRRPAAVPVGTLTPALTERLPPPSVDSFAWFCLTATNRHQSPQPTPERSP
ncbi:hypothetical protein [Leptolyngbya sp. CCY15150]|uniref:hypothetical protein n=1 Tax=Leptolyngbya sp. CCY15150 TaxID=2767772 RepID=UPI00194DE255|nr:hypothetical protein [Leptolyngbya sp. CCY15150]